VLVGTALCAFAYPTLAAHCGYGHDASYIVPIRMVYQRSQPRDASGIECGSSADQVKCRHPPTKGILVNAVIVNLSCPLRLAARPDFVRYHLRMLLAREKPAFAWGLAL
jgi:hypothetical protein